MAPLAVNLPAGGPGPIDYAEAWTICWGDGCIELDPSEIDHNGLCSFHRREIIGSPRSVTNGATVGLCPATTT